MSNGTSHIDNMGRRLLQSERDARRTAVRTAVELLGPATQLHRTTETVVGQTDKPKGIQGIYSGETRPGDRREIDTLTYVADVLALADFIVTGETE